MALEEKVWEFVKERVDEAEERDEAVPKLVLELLVGVSFANCREEEDLRRLFGLGWELSDCELEEGKESGTVDLRFPTTYVRVKPSWGFKPKKQWLLFVEKKEKNALRLKKLKKFLEKEAEKLGFEAEVKESREGFLVRLKGPLFEEEREFFFLSREKLEKLLEEVKEKLKKKKEELLEEKEKLKKRLLKLEKLEKALRELEKNS